MIRGQKDENTQRSLSIIEFPLTVRICIKTIIRSNVFQHCFLIIPPPPPLFMHSDLQLPVTNMSGPDPGDWGNCTDSGKE